MPQERAGRGHARRAPAGPPPGRLRAHPGGDGRTVSRRRLERPGRAQPERRRSQRHPLELRRRLGHRRGRPADDQARAPGPVERLRAAGRRAPSTSGTATATGRYSLYSTRHRRELPARRAGGRRRRRRDVHEHLPGLLLGPLAAHPLRGLPEPRRRRRTPRTRSRHRRSRSRRTPATRCTRRTGTARASGNLRR